MCSSGMIEGKSGRKGGKSTERERVIGKVMVKEKTSGDIRVKERMRRREKETERNG